MARIRAPSFPNRPPVLGYVMRDFTPQWFRDLTLSRKFFVSFGVLLALLGLTLAGSLFYLSKVNSYVDRHRRITVPAMATASKMERLGFEMSFALHRFLLNPSTSAATRASAKLQDLGDQLREALTLYRTVHAARTHPVLFGMLADHGQTALAEQEERALDEIGSAVEALAAQWTAHLPPEPAHAGEVRLRESVESDQQFQRLTSALRQLVDSQSRMAVEMKREGDRLEQQARLLILGLVIVLAAMIAAAFLTVRRHVADPLTALARTADRVAGQDLSATFEPWPSRDEVGALSRSLGTMLTTLQERTKALERKTKELEGFTYSIAHDLKGPLREIEGFSSLLERQHAADLSETARHYVSTIRGSVLRLSGLIDDLLRYARLEQQALMRSSVPLKPLIESVLRDQARAIETTGCRVTLDCPDVTLQGDAAGLRQVLLNLIANALKFSRQAHPPELRLGARSTGMETVVWVKDNGIGFEQKDADKIFGLFERLHGPDRYEGTGVGLAIVKLIMEKQGGRVWAESDPGKGAAFYLALPAQRDASGEIRETNGDTSDRCAF